MNNDTLYILLYRDGDTSGGSIYQGLEMPNTGNNRRNHPITRHLGYLHLDERRFMKAKKYQHKVSQILDDGLLLNGSFNLRVRPLKPFLEQQGHPADFVELILSHYSSYITRSEYQKPRVLERFWKSLSWYT